MKRLIIALFTVIAMSLTSVAFAAGTTTAIEKAKANSIQEDRIETIIENAVNKHIANIGNEEGASDIMDSIGEILAIIGIFGMPFIMVILIVAISMKNETKRRQIKYEMVNKAIEHGYQLPEYVFRDENKENRKKNPMNIAIYSIAIGLALMIFGIIKGNVNITILSMVPLLIGGGQIALYIIENRKNNKMEEDNKPAGKEDAEQI